MRYGALNPVSEGVWLAVMEDDTLLINTFSPMKSREAAGLPGFVEHTLAEHGLKISDIKFWSTGAGPGGFTALRMTAALIAAWALEHDDIKFRCVPAAFALTGRFPGKEGDQLDCLFDGRNREILLYGMEYKNGHWESRDFSAVLNSEDFQTYKASAPGRFITDAAEYDAVIKITGSEDIEKCVSECADLIRTTALPYDNNADNLVYIREAVELRG